MSAILKEPDLDFLLMTENDLDEVMSIEEEVYPFPWTKGIFHDCLHVGYCCRVLKKNGEVVAYSIMSAAAGESHLLTIVVAPSEQGQGYGKVMLNNMIDLAISHHVTMMYLEVRPSNKNAIHIYHQRGFNEVGVRNNYYPAENGREDALIMALDTSFTNNPDEHLR
jgi:ribosomal-protein-alanine N-acetyltransferase